MDYNVCGQQVKGVSTLCSHAFCSLLIRKLSRGILWPTHIMHAWIAVGEGAQSRDELPHLSALHLHNSCIQFCIKREPNSEVQDSPCKAFLVHFDNQQCNVDTSECPQAFTILAFNLLY